MLAWVWWSALWLSGSVALLRLFWARLCGYFSCVAFGLVVW